MESQKSIDRRIISTQDAPQAIGPYSQAVLCDGWLYVSGQIPINPKNSELVSNNIALETQQVIDNLKAIVNEAGASMSTIVKCTIYITDMGLFEEINDVYRENFEQPFPARAVVEVASLPKGVRIEMDAIARI